MISFFLKKRDQLKFKNISINIVLKSIDVWTKHVKHMKKDRKEKTKFSEILPSNQIITTCRIQLRAKEMTMNEKLTMIGLRWNRNIFTFNFSNKQSNSDRKWGQTSFQISSNVFLIKESSLQYNCSPYRRHAVT